MPVEGEKLSLRAKMKGASTANLSFYAGDQQAALDAYQNIERKIDKGDVSPETKKALERARVRLTIFGIKITL